MQKLLTKQNILYAAWLQALVASLGSFSYSAIMKIPPCSLCWYQRIFMYPLAFILTVGIIRRDKDVDMYVLPLSIPGLIIAFYHVLLQEGIIPQAIRPCAAGVDCAIKHPMYFDTITIPQLSLTAFLIITLLMVYYRKLKKK
jgi:disulfide bond formation protein DsbB